MIKPISCLSDLEQAVSSYRDSSDEAVRRYIVRRARDLGRTDVLPHSWRPSLEKAARSPRLREALETKVREHNLVASPGRQTTLPRVAAVYKRGLADFTSRPITGLSCEQYAQSRVTAFLRMLRTGEVRGTLCSQDIDLLPVSLSAAIDPEFERLHPRGRDGKFIEKGAIVKIFDKIDRSLAPRIGTVDAIEKDGSISVTLRDGSKINAQPRQIEQEHAVARLDSPNGKASHDGTDGAHPGLPDGHDDGADEVQPGAASPFPGFEPDERARMLGDLQSSVGLDEATAQRVVAELDAFRKRFGVRVGVIGPGDPDRIEDDGTASVDVAGVLRIRAERLHRLEKSFASGWIATDSLEGLISHEMTHMLQFGYSERGAYHFQYASALAEKATIDKHFNGDRLAYITERNKLSGYLMQDTDGVEAEAEMLSGYLHRTEVPDWLKTWGDTFESEFTSDKDFSAAYGYHFTEGTDRGGVPAASTNPDDNLPNFDWDSDDPSGMTYVPPKNVPDIPEEYLRSDKDSPAIKVMGKREFVEYTRKDGTTTRVGRNTKPLAKFLEDSGFNLESMADGSTHDSDYPSEWSPAVVVFSDKESFDRFIQESGLDVQLVEGGNFRLLYRSPGIKYKVGIAHEHLLQVQLPPYQVPQIISRMWSQQHGVDPNLPPLDVKPVGDPTDPPDLGLPDSAGLTGEKKITARETMRPATPQDRARLKVPPGWTDVVVAHSPDIELQVIGRDKAGREQYRYNDAHDVRVAEIKFARMAALHELLPQLDAALEADAGDDTADCVYLMRTMAIRNGSKTDTKAKKKAYGATTLQARHVVVDDAGNVRLDFDAKDSVHMNLPVTDERLRKMLIARKAGRDDSTLLFVTDNTKTNSYLKSKTGEEFKIKDLRTYFANEKALQIIAGMPMPTNEAELVKAKRDVAVQVAALLGNTPAVAQRDYLNPTIYSKWYGALLLRRQDNTDS